MSADMSPGEAMMRAYAEILSRDGTRVVYVEKAELTQHAVATTARQVVDWPAGERRSPVAR